MKATLLFAHRFTTVLLALALVVGHVGIWPGWAAAPEARLRLGMYLDVVATDAAATRSALATPASAVQHVDVEFTPSKTGEVTFTCGMDMLKGAVVVQ